MAIQQNHIRTNQAQGDMLQKYKCRRLIYLGNILAIENYINFVKVIPLEFSMKVNTFSQTFAYKLSLSIY